MKKLFTLTLAALLVWFFCLPLTAQVDESAKKLEDKGIDKVEEGIGNLFKKKKKNKDVKDEPAEQGQDADQDQQTKTTDQSGGEKTAGPELVWSKYDFVPGDKIIFEDNQLNEENGEFPSRWDLVNGNVENVVFGGEDVIMFRGGHAIIVPYLKNPDQDYLPDVFTVEFDLYLPNNFFQVYFYDRKNQEPTAGNNSLNIWQDRMELRPASSYLPDKGNIANTWAHISVAYTNGKLKAYINETRLINIPHAEFNPTGISVQAYHGTDQNRFYIKNFRIAEGGVKYYDRVLQDGKIIANGIRFDVNKATLRPESMGVINEIYDLMKENPDLKFSVEGHTDSDGEADFNQELSVKRAETVVKTLENLGISSDRLSSTGWGESKPITGNDTAEGKATNRRVEFVKM